jgi:hypothetical protein
MNFFFQELTMDSTNGAKPGNVYELNGARWRVDGGELRRLCRGFDDTCSNYVVGRYLCETHLNERRKLKHQKTV